MEHYETLTEAMNTLKHQGYTEDFNLKQNCIECRARNFSIFHDEFQIDKSFRFDHLEDPSDQAVVYAISSDKYKIKGILVNGVGIYSEEITNEMLEKLE